jgi:multicomponent Na+:H+ antiporter subunit D
MSYLIGWLVWTPFAGSVLSYLLGRRASPLVGLTGAFATAGLVAGLAMELGQRGVLRYAIGGWRAPLGIELYADGLAVFMLAVTAAVGVMVSLYASAYFRAELRFWPLWLLLWGGMNALYLSADLFNLYVCLELVGLSAVVLIVLAGRREALAAALRYLLATVLGSLFYLLGVALLYAEHGVLNLELLGEVVSGRGAAAALVLLALGLLVKAAIFPFHFWLPTAHTFAPAPVSAVLSALVVKTAYYVLLRLWLQVFADLELVATAQLLAALGAMAIIYGSLQALRQRRLKLLIAYSTVAQLGYLVFFFPLAALPEVKLAAYQGTLYHVLAHALVKAALFLASGAMIHALGHDRLYGLRALAGKLPLTTFVIAVASASLVGLPPSGGFVAKWLLLSASWEGG